VVYNITNYYDHSTHNHYHAPPSPSYTYKLDPKLDWLPPCPPGSKVFQDDRGRLYKQCMSRGCPHRSISLFAPPTTRIRERGPFLSAVAAAEAAVAAEDAAGFAAGFAAAREAVNGLATATCQRCRDRCREAQYRPEAKVQQCKEEWERMKATQFSECAECGCKHAVESNHMKKYADNAKLHMAYVRIHGKEAADKEYPAAERKLECLSNYPGWARPKLGGVAGMRAEAPKCGPLCSMCHALDPSSNQANENRSDPAKVKREGKTREQFMQARKTAIYRKEARDYVNKLKLLVEMCERPDCPCDGARIGGMVIQGHEQCFDWDHIDERTKGRSIGKICSASRCLRTAKSEIHVELGLSADFDIDSDPMPPPERRKCRLLCKNCHREREQWDPRAARQ
jgi:hypothetical protein